jgi:hypothetical protein
LGKKGNFKADDLVDIIFQHPKAAHRLTEKLLKWFYSDTPSVEMVEEYALHFKKNNFEIKPFLLKLIEDQRFIKSQGSKIKDPLTFFLQILNAFDIDLPQTRVVLNYIKEQDMHLLNPPNVKGWDGGQAWLSSQKLLQRVSMVTPLSSGKSFDVFKFKRKQENAMEEMNMQEASFLKYNPAKSKPVFQWNKNLNNNKDIIKDLCDKWIFNVSADMQQDMEQVLKYDFNPKDENAQFAVTRLAEYIFKSPEFQIY